MKKVLLTGASGFLGCHIIKRLKNKYDLWAITHSSPLPDMKNIKIIKADLTKPGSLANAVRESAPDLVIHTAAMCNTSLCEKNPELSRRINVDATLEMLEVLDPEKSRLIFCSTDLVFDGLGTFYNENDKVNPKMVYARHKYDAEKAIRKWGDNHAILRLALMYGVALGNNKSFISWLENGLKKGSVTLFSDEFRTPLYVEDAVTAIEKLTESDFRGTMHIGGAKRCSRYDFGIEFALRSNYNFSCINEISSKNAGLKIYRPPDVSLNITLAKNILGFNPVSISGGIDLYMKNITGKPEGCEG
jgi:dTDP-4-dehydrorhamnose reductase